MIKETRIPRGDTNGVGEDEVTVTSGLQASETKVTSLRETLVCTHFSDETGRAKSKFFQEHSADTSTNLSRFRFSLPSA